MDAVYVYLITSSTLFLSGWVVLLLVAYALVFQGETLTTKDTKVARRKNLPPRTPHDFVSFGVVPVRINPSCGSQH
jgi:hypothetical protein